MGDTVRRGGFGSGQGGGPTTLHDLAMKGLGVFCWCNRCSHNAVLSVGPLIARLGPGQPLPGLVRHLRCAACGSRDVAARPDWPGLGQVAHHRALDDDERA